MGLLDIFSRERKVANESYLKVRSDIFKKAREQSFKRNIEHISECSKILTLTGSIEYRAENPVYWDVANLLLAEYPTELGVMISNAFSTFSSKLGHDPHDKIVFAMQNLDEWAGTTFAVKKSFFKKHPKLFEYMLSKECPERYERSVEFLTESLFVLDKVSSLKKVFPRVLVVEKVKSSVGERLRSVDDVVADYVLK